MQSQIISLPVKSLLCIRLKDLLSIKKQAVAEVAFSKYSFLVLKS